MNESKFLGQKMTDFEMNLFLKKEVSELKKVIADKDFKIGELKSEVDELKYQIKGKDNQLAQRHLSKSQIKNLRYSLKDSLSLNYKANIKRMEEAIVSRNNKIKELEKIIENMVKQLDL